MPEADQVPDRLPAGVVVVVDAQVGLVGALASGGDDGQAHELQSTSSMPLTTAPENHRSMCGTTSATHRARPTVWPCPRRWRNAPPGVLAFDRGPGFRCIVTMSQEVHTLTSEGLRTVLASTPGEGHLLRPDQAVWLAAGAAGS